MDHRSIGAGESGKGTALGLHYPHADVLLNKDTAAKLLKSIGDLARLCGYERNDGDRNCQTRGEGEAWSAPLDDDKGQHRISKSCLHGRAGARGTVVAMECRKGGLVDYALASGAHTSSKTSAA
ncbi:hypothetical protein J5N97_024204 [Dioscorea zingiberensis]|uniref:Uncharacterized protein n=1 Tax=Dioscorea zingiberensis TaxID=325984 RepID=A0A9D5C7A5_9LILI|nr:hypothetical protein J5N97_024204 [Dioscorea zingiberensis]